MTKTMNKAKYLLAFLAAAILAVALSSVAWAAENGTITITPPENVDATATNTYKVYKVFDAVGNGTAETPGTAISYKLVNGKTTAPAGFTVDSAGNVTYTGTGTNGELTQADIAAIADYVKNDQPVATVTSTGTANAVTEPLPNGYYYITTSVGTVVTIDSTNPNATVADKNTVPTVNKTITGASDITDQGKKALAQIGTDVEYTATVTVGKGSKNLVFHDTMQTGLTFKGNDSVTLTGVTAEQYTIKATPDAGETITITFADGIPEGTVITVKYLATINANALTKLENDAYVSYGDNSSYKSEHSKTEVYNAEIGLVKFDGKNTDTTNDDTNLSGAKFVLSKDVPAQGEEGSEGYVAAHVEYYKLDGTVVSWVTDIAQATVRTSGTDGKLDAKFTGLPNGRYKLVETEAPAGFNAVADIPIEIASGNYTAANLSKSTDVINNQGSVLPSTGGMGTTILYIVGGIMVLVAVVFLITKRRVKSGRGGDDLM